MLKLKMQIGDDNKGEVYGIYFTDLGFLRYADFLYTSLLNLDL